MKFEKWNLPASAPSAAALEEAGYPALLSAVLAAHGIADGPAAADFLRIEGCPPPFPLPDEGHGPSRRPYPPRPGRGEHIAVFGDYDVDGITATAILVDYLRCSGARVSHYIPPPHRGWLWPLRGRHARPARPGHCPWWSLWIAASPAWRRWILPPPSGMDSGGDGPS